MIHTKVAFTTSFEAWFLDGMRQLATQTNKDVNELIQEAMLKEHPQISKLKGGFVGRVLAPRSTSGTSGNS